MKSKMEQTTSVWMQHGEISLHAKLTKDAQVDVCVIGAGIAGLTTANDSLSVGPK